ncbi:MAG: biotin/lipoate A/B protein ligase family protein [bacterium]|nr:biotin/lipoate A/B protein ligase family protein [bacterium]
MKHAPYPWRFLNTQFGNAFFNMAADEAVVRSVEKGDSSPTFRVYGWKPPAVSFGYAQRVRREIDPQACQDKGIDIVRRPTGGRAVLHWNELTYSVLCRADDPLLGGTIQEAYRKISTCLVAGIQHLGIDAQFEPRRQTIPSPRGKDLTLPCFSSTAQYEIILNGRKLLGSAQKRFGPMLLQHGSLLLGPEHKQIVDLIPAKKETLKTRFRTELETHTTSLYEVLNRPVSFKEIATALRRGLLETLHITLMDAPLSKAETESAERLVAEKYSTDTWTFQT